MTYELKYEPNLNKIYHLVKKLGLYELVRDGSTNDFVTSDTNSYMVCILNGKPIGLFVVTPITDVTVRISPLLAKQFHGKIESSKFHDLLEEQALKFTPIKTFIALIPETLKSICRRAIRQGYSLCGTIPEGVIWNNELQAVNIYLKRIKS